MALSTPQARRDPRSARFRSAFEAPSLITRLDLSWGGSFAPQIRSWADYWRAVQWLGGPKIDGALRQLGAAWQKYIVSSFDPSLAREYCFRYFSLLDTVLSARGELSASPLWQRALQAVLGFESFTINEAAFGPEGGAAGTTTLRNPGYLLAKLKWPDAPDDTRFHPLTLAGDGRPDLFFHYRRYRLSEDAPMSLLVYPAVDPARRSRSFRLVATLASALGSVGDPFAEARAERLWESVMRPILRSAHAGWPSRVPIELVDIGAGSGALMAALSRELVAWSQAGGFTPRLRLWLVDLAAPATMSVFRTPPLGRFVENLATVSMDCRTWLASPGRLPAASGPRVARASKILDVSSRFAIHSFRTDVLSSVVGEPRGLERERHMPERCLAPSGEGPNALQMSSSRVVVDEGHAFPLASLSGFFRGLRLVSQSGSDDGAEEDGLWLPVRSLDPQSLVAADGASVIGRLLEQCDYLIVEDADLRPRDLIDHLRAFWLQGIAVQDMTRAMGLKANYAYVLWPRGPRAPRLEGERLW
ncbi:MAG: hypothetical protein A2W26_03010 [Acidobacteria bacterium RBG_16_64_8]|nr:MAG: hypothetical protein A2W26_03010 [Acidobacteria bacterium RBG_16_64_8]